LHVTLYIGLNCTISSGRSLNSFTNLADARHNHIIGSNQLKKGKLMILSVNWHRRCIYSIVKQPNYREFKPIKGDRMNKAKRVKKMAELAAFLAIMTIGGNACAADRIQTADSSRNTAIANEQRGNAARLDERRNNNGDNFLTFFIFDRQVPLFAELAPIDTLVNNGGR
jgi:hypothetical protein